MIDIYLYVEAADPNDIILSRSPRPVPLGKRTRAIFVGVPDEEPPIAQSLFHSLVEQYGNEEGALVWARMLVERKGPFADGAKYDPAKPEVAIELIDSGLHPDGRLAIKPLLPYDETADEQPEERE